MARVSFFFLGGGTPKDYKPAGTSITGEYYVNVIKQMFADDSIGRMQPSMLIEVILSMQAHLPRWTI